MNLFLTSHAPLQSHLMESLFTLVFTECCFYPICPSVIPLYSYSTRFVTFDLVVGQVLFCKTWWKIMNSNYTITVIRNTKFTSKRIAPDHSLGQLRLGSEINELIFIKQFLCQKSKDNPSLTKVETFSRG